MRPGDRVFLKYLGYSMELSTGETIIGRALTCQMRFNDPSVSREHARLRVEGGSVMVEDLGSRNGTQLNGRPLHRPSEVAHGDTIQIGARTLTVHIVSGAAPAGSMATPTPPERLPAKAAVRAASQQRCPECRAPVSFEDNFCRACGHTWSDFRPGSITQQVEIANGKPVPPRPESRERRRSVRQRVRVPVLYTSENLTVETLALNLSRSGVFVKTQILDTLGTRCLLTLMLDGAPAITFPGRVSRVVDNGSQEPLGLGIEFVGLDRPAQEWLDGILVRLVDP